MKPTCPKCGKEVVYYDHDKHGHIIDADNADAGIIEFGDPDEDYSSTYVCEPCGIICDECEVLEDPQDSSYDGS